MPRPLEPWPFAVRHSDRLAVARLHPGRPSAPKLAMAWARLGSACLASCVVTVASAQQAPDAGRLLQETRPATVPSPPAAAPRLLDTPVRPTVTMPEGLTVTPSAFRITGAVSIPAEELQSLVKPWVGRSLDLRGLNEAAGAITRRYQSAGHFLSYAYLPAQRVADGVIEIAVLEGRIDAVQVANAQDVRLRDEVVQAHVDGLADRTPLVQDDVERKLLLLNDLPGVTARAAFTPGASTGTADMVVTVAEDEPLELRFDVNNHGARSTGQTRLGATLALRDLFGFGDVTTARALVSQRGALVSGSLGTLVPVGGDGWKVGLSTSRLQYELGGAFASLGAQGTAETWGLRATHPVYRTPRANLSLDANLEYKRLLDDITLTGTRKPKRNAVASLGLSFDRRDDLLGGGVSFGSATYSGGELRLLDEASWLLDRFGPAGGNGVGLRTDGGWEKGQLNLARQQTLYGPLSAYLRYSAQRARGNLDSSEKLALGGPSGVRAYGGGEALVDNGGIVSAELRWLQEYTGGNLLWSLFYDRATGRYNVHPLFGTTDLEVYLAGGGVGLQWNGGDVGLATSLAWRRTTSRIPTAEGGDPRPRIFIQLLYTP